MAIPTSGFKGRVLLIIQTSVELERSEDFVSRSGRLIKDVVVSSAGLIKSDQSSRTLLKGTGHGVSRLGGIVCRPTLNPLTRACLSNFREADPATGVRHLAVSPTDEVRCNQPRQCSQVTGMAISVATVTGAIAEAQNAPNSPSSKPLHAEMYRSSRTPCSLSLSLCLYVCTQLEATPKPCSPLFML